MTDLRIISLKLSKLLTKVTLVAVICTTIFNLNFLLDSTNAAVNAATSTNLIKNGSFESDIDTNWKTWNGPESTRQYNLYRSYDVAYGNGSYSAAIEAKGAPETRWFAGLVGDNKTSYFQVVADKTYYLIFYAKGNSNFTFSAYLENASTFATITSVNPIAITTEWQKYIVSFTSNSSTNAILSFMYGDLPDSGLLLLDGIQLFQSDIFLSTSEVKGYIGEINKSVQVSNISFFNENDIDIELPFYDGQTSSITAKKFHPEKIVGNTIYFNIYNQTFSGIGSLYIDGSLIGKFNYIVLPKITGFFPTLLRPDQDLTINGSGFSPVIDSSRSYIYAILTTTDATGRKSEKWIIPDVFDSKLTQLTLKLPIGIVSGRLYVQTSYRNIQEKDITVNSNTLNYKVKPIIFSLEWSKRGYDQVGDKLIIHGKGIANSPQVIFYDSQNNVITKTNAVLKSITNEEVIEVPTPEKINSLNVTVMVDGVESDHEQALSYSAKPRLISISTKKSRRINSNGQTIAAAKIGEVITLNGQGFTPIALSSIVEFQGNGANKITTDIISVDPSGRTIKVAVPDGAQNGYLTVIINNQKSNILPLEIIPTILSVSPNPVEPGQFMQIRANGVGSNVNLTSIYFNLANDKQEKITPTENSVAGAVTYINVRALPLAISNQYSSINIQYENWRDDGTTVLVAQPHITDASIDMDDKTLIIRGYGFSIKPNENTITYKYADAARTVINPKVIMIGVFPTEEGQEIRVRILDNYYYGYVTVTVNGQTSNEANFGPVQIRQISRRIEFVKSVGKVMGVLYINGYNFGSKGGVMVGSQWAEIHYRSEFFIIAVIDQQYLYGNPVIVTKE